MTIQPTLSFNVKPQKNILDGITLYEPVDKSLLIKLINSDLLKKKFHNKISTKFYENEKKQLEAYLRLMKNGKIAVKYSRSESNPYGRSNPAFALGLYPIRREIRHTLASERFVDLDVENCHPEMLNQLCIEENIEHGKLNDYVTNRDSYFHQIMTIYGCTRDDAKVLFIRLSYGGAFPNWVRDTEISLESCHESVTKSSYITPIKLITDFKESMLIVHESILKVNPELAEIVIKSKAEKAKK
jgi:hypothetical protein